MRITVFNHVTLDGVMQSPAGADEDTRGGFTRGGWAADDSDEVSIGQEPSSHFVFTRKARPWSMAVQASNGAMGVPLLRRKGRPSMSRISARGEMPSDWKMVAWMSGGPQG